MSDENASLELRPGEVLGDQYRILGVLGTGGMAVVYRAESLKHGGEVAIKTLRVRDPDVEARFAHEVRVHSRLDHANIVRALDCLVDEVSSRTYFVMELFDGETLKDILRRQGAPSDGRIIYDILRQLTDAIDHAHRQEVIHRDIKPANVIVSLKEGDIGVKIVDFGIARIVEDMQRLTREGTVVGSAFYMSPEQCMGLVPDRRSDVYGLACLAYELATGVLPYRDGDITRIMEKHCDPHTAPPSVTAVLPMFPGAKQYDAMIEKGMRTDPDERYQSMGEFRKGLDFWIRSVDRDSLVPPLVISEPVSSGGSGSASSADQDAASAGGKSPTPAVADLPDGDRENIRDLVGAQRSAQIDAFWRRGNGRTSSAGSGIIRAVLLSLLGIALLAGVSMLAAPALEKVFAGRTESARRAGDAAVGEGGRAGNAVDTGENADSGESEFESDDEGSRPVRILAPGVYR
ncbi:MAG: serine/threonine protein kinase [Candidatus Melainabacteria bacterium]|nr:serine/threonine protein kinase [Candidatus Melainabacteria bacterium]